MAKIQFTSGEQAIAAEAMISQMRGQLLQSTVLDRLLTRKKLANQMTTADMNADGQNRAQIGNLNHSIEHLEAIHSELVAEAEKAK